MEENQWGLTQEELEIINGEDFEDVSPNIFVPSFLSKRALRRSQRERKVSKAQKVLRSLFGEDKVQHAPLWADNLQKCSCHMCCNPRRNEFVKGKDKLTLAEIKALDSANDQLKEVQSEQL